MVNKSQTSGPPKAPPLLLLALVSEFLANNGFNSSARIFNTERKKRPKKEGWMGTLGKNYTAGVPRLESIFTQWQESRNSGAKSGQVHKGSDGAVAAASDNSSSDDSAGAEESSSGSESDSEGSAQVVVSKSAIKRKGAPSASSSSSSGEDSLSDSDSDDDDEDIAGSHVIEPASNPLKRKAVDTSSESSASSASGTDPSSESDGSLSEDEARPVKKAKVDTSTSESGSESSSESDEVAFAANIKLPLSTSSDTDSSSDDSDDSDDDDNGVVPPDSTGGTSSEEPLSESSGTVTGEIRSSESTSSTSRGDTGLQTVKLEQTTVKRKHVGAQPTRLAQLSANADPAEFISNSYVSYDYADKAYRDLVVTRGKGFTKEKNKKKRGSYRGGMIDTSGGKGFKFED